MVRKINLIAPLSTNQYEYLQRVKHSWFNVAEGGKRGGKNVLNVLAFAMELEEHPNRLHLIGAVSIGNAKLNIVDCDGFGLANYFGERLREGKYKNKEALFIQTKTGEKIIIIAGGAKSGDEKYIKGNTYGMALITEANECHIKFIKEVFDRTLTSKKRKIFHDFNPKSEGHFYYEDVLNFHEAKQAKNPAYGLNYGHFTIRDNMSITQEQLDEVLSQYDPKSIWFKRDILGLRKQTEGLVYSMFNRDFNVVKTVPRPYKEYIITNDYGTNHPCVFGLFGFDGGVWYQIKEYYHHGEKEKQKTVGEYYDELLKFLGDIPTKSIDWFYLDNAPVASSFNIHLKQQGKFRSKLADNEVLAGIQNVATALTTGKLKINDCCKNTIREFGLYRWKENSTTDEPLMENDDCMAMLRYFVKTKGINKR